MRRAFIVLVLSLSLSACTYGELLDFVEGSGSGDLSSEENPVDVRAAGSIAEALADDERAQDKVTEALDPDLGIGTKIRLAGDAVRLRPVDPRYLMYRYWFNALAGDWEAGEADMATARRLSDEAYGAADGKRRFAEFFMDATIAVLLTYPADSANRVGMELAYCVVVARYRREFGETLLGSAYLDFKSHQELCSA